MRLPRPPPSLSYNHDLDNDFNDDNDGGRRSAPANGEPESVGVAANFSYRFGDTASAAIDVCYSTEVAGGPVVVLLHGGGLEKRSLCYPRLATAIAEQGAVIFVPNWGGETGSAGSDRASCAVSYALANDAEFGADPGVLVLFGHSG